MKSARQLEAELKRIESEATVRRAQSFLACREAIDENKKADAVEMLRKKVAATRLQCLESRLADCVIRVRKTPVTREYSRQPRIRPIVVVHRQPDKLQSSDNATVQHYLKGRLICDKVIRDRLKCLDSKAASALAKTTIAEQVKRQKCQLIQCEISKVMMT